MIVIGLTGSIASGKSSIAAVFKRYHLPVFDSDKQVHKLLAPRGQAVGAILSEFGSVGTFENGIDRAALGATVFQDKGALRALEAILHPRVAQARMRFLQQSRMNRRRAVLLDIPLLFETGADDVCDVTVMAWAPYRLIRQRALARPHMTATKLDNILSQQMSQSEKLKLADEKIATGLGYGAMTKQIHHLLSKWRLRT